MELSLRCFFRDFNAAKFVLYNCLVGFCVLFALRLDETVQLNYAIVFLPLWLCEAIVFIGAFVALISYIISPPSTSELAIRSDFYGLILCAGEHSLLTMFEVLVCYKLQSQLSLDELPWLLVFAPLFTLSLLSIVIAVWAIRHDKSFEFELFFSINVVQFVFLAFKLDATLDWHWAIVFIPLWVVLSLSVVGVLYALVLAIVLARSVHMLASQRRQHLYSALCHTLLVIPILVFLLLLTGKLDAVAWSEDEQVTQVPYIVVCSPLIISLICLVLMSFGARGGNPWWFGMRAPFCTFLLETCPCLKQYANLRYKFGTSSDRDTASADAERQSLRSDRSSKIPLRPIIPIRS
uniref:Rab-like protein 3 n=2 Tax=Parascaris univalens TaxID=6257 RepID=A0A914ZIX1_PARUN